MTLFALLLSLLAGGAFTALQGFAPGGATKPKPLPGGLSGSIKPNVTNNPQSADTPAWLTGKNNDNEIVEVFSDQPRSNSVVKAASLTEGFNSEQPLVPKNEIPTKSPLSRVGSSINFEQTITEKRVDAPPKVIDANGSNGYDLVVDPPKDLPQEHFREPDHAPFSIHSPSTADRQEHQSPLTPISAWLTAEEVEGPDIRAASLLVV